MTTLTDSQQQAIQARGNVLVAAGAGTGKTSTLVQRCVDLLLEEENCSLDQILMVTFTEAAAAQMRSRIHDELRQRQQALGDPAAAAHLSQQLALLDTAHICTLHSFCLHLVRQHFYQLGIDPAITVLDERQTTPLMTQTLDALFQRYYAGDTLEAVAVQELVSHLGRGFDERIRGLIVRIHRYTQSLDDPEGWLARHEAVYQHEDPAAWREWLEAGFNDWRELWLPALPAKSPIPAIRCFHQALAKLAPKSPKQTCGCKQIAEALQRIQEADAKEENWPWGTKQENRGPLKGFLADVEFLCSALAEGKTNPIRQDWEWVRPHMYTLFRLTREFTAAFSKAKRELGGLDFADLEQFALRLLRDAAIARQWQERLRFIFVDEYQDINRAQDAILTALSRERTQPNRFLVGDVKQSIYRFRLANPKIFREYEEFWRRDKTAGRRIPLADNFRSREALLQFLNPLFAALMRPGVGGVAYEADAHLRFAKAGERQALSIAAGATGENNPAAPRVELHLIDRADEDGEPAEGGEDQSQAQAALLDLLAVEREARLVALRLRELKEQKHLVWDPAGEAFRPVEWRDMAVLHRSPGDKAEAFAKEFNRLGVPLVAARSGFFQSLEISDLLSLLKLIDNPLQDVPVLAVLRSPLVGLSLDELVEIRAHNREKRFWFALRKFHRDQAAQASLSADSGKAAAEAPEPNPQLAIGNWQLAMSKTDLFLSQFERWRELARQSALSLCLETVLTETHYEALLLAEPRGEERAANVRRLLELAREYDPYQRQGLYRFLRFVAAQEEAAVEQEPASAQTENAVHLMSIHRAKGLEFPVVALAGLGVNFNLQDLRQEILIHEQYGLCPRVKPPEADQSYPSLPFWLARREEQRELLGEELRLLYVAMTRARDTLILAGTGKEPRWGRGEGAGEQVGECESEKRAATSALAGRRRASSSEKEPAPITDREVLSARNYLDWLLLWLPQVTSPGDWTSDREGATPLVRWTIYAANDPRLVAAPAEDGGPAAELLGLGGELDEVGLLKLQDRIAWQYPHRAATVEPAIKNVTGLIQQQAGAGEEAQLRLDAELAPAAPLAPVRRRASQLAAAEVGTAHHRFLELVALDRVGRLEDLKEEARQMVADGALGKEEFAALDFKAILAFWQSEVGRRILSVPPQMIHREVPFTARFSPEDLAPLGLCVNAAALAGEYFVVRGQVDLAVIQPREIWLVDFKTDRISPAEAPEKIRQYAPQLKLYALALSRIYRRPVTRQWLHLLGARETVAVSGA